ncbi:glycosyltransferase [Azorhizobium doebereinerae]|uniref:glycosyltransferase n=1 Tax=Azorhizobium doebereinerae TaxID=281091 RepID=UPI00041D48E5|nr:glycosyltransferase [Azorhizobium doebereinerae]
MSADLVVFGEDWGSHPSSTQHLVTRLARSRRVLWVNSIGLRRPRLDAHDLRRLAGKLKALVAGRGAPRPAAATLPAGPAGIVSPIAIPWPGSALAEAANRVLLGRQVRGAMAAAGISRPILWASLPSAVSVAGALGERALVYYCGDDFGALTGVDHAPVLEMEARLAARADLIVAASAALAARFPGRNVLLLPHGVDAALFAAPAPRPADLPSGPVAGFYGSISDWLDIAMLVAAARALPGWTFVFVGPVRTDVSALEGLPNVRFLGPRPHDALPAYVQHWDVSLIPFRDTAQIRACNPLKLREYLASGTPIAATRFPALAPYEDVVASIAPGGDLAAAIRAAAADPRAAERRAAVAAEDWDARAAVLSAALDRL